MQPFRRTVAAQLPFRWVTNKAPKPMALWTSTRMDPDMYPPVATCIIKQRSERLASAFAAIKP